MNKDTYTGNSILSFYQFLILRSSTSSGTQRRNRPALPQGCHYDSTTRFNETRPCNTHPCAEYEIEEGEWNECQQVGPSVTCSRSQSMVFEVNFGLQYRNVTCYSPQGQIVPQKYCEEFFDEKFDTKVNRIFINFQLKVIGISPSI